VKWNLYLCAVIAIKMCVHCTDCALHIAMSDTLFKLQLKLFILQVNSDKFFCQKLSTTTYEIM